MMNAFPTSSCPSEGCAAFPRPFVQRDSCAIIPNNLANTQNNNSFYCSNIAKLNDLEIQPRDGGRTIPGGEIVRNLNELDLRYDYDGYKRSANEHFVGSNPLLRDVPRGGTIILDRPNLSADVPVGDVCHDEIYSRRISEIGKGYNSYLDINGGQILYYVDLSTADAFNPPNFVSPAVVTKRLRKDPMDVVYPEYIRKVWTDDQGAPAGFTQYSWDNCAPDACDSFTHDSLEFRQELMESQSSKMNNRKWSARWPVFS